MKYSKTGSLPVAMYHYVNCLEGGITVTPACFEEHCRVLAAKGWRGVGLEEAEAFLADGAPLPPRSILLTFDDGYLDNYLCALPILRQYGHRGVVFAVSNRLEPGTTPRASLRDVLDGKAVVPERVARPVEHSAQGFAIRRDVFLNHAEAGAMDGSGILRVAAHSRGHYGVYTGPEHTDFFQPRRRFRTFYRTEDAQIWGMPEFPVKAGLTHRAFVPNPELEAAVSGLVPQDFDGAAAFFASEANVRELRALVAGFSGRLGRFETDEERRDRMWREIAGGKEELEGILGHPVQSLCWPWGEYGEQALRLALDAGFRVFFTTREGVNPAGRSLAVRRFKAKSKSGAWLASRAWIYSRPLLGAVYARARV